MTRVLTGLAALAKSRLKGCHDMVQCQRLLRCDRAQIRFQGEHLIDLNPLGLFRGSLFGAASSKQGTPSRTVSRLRLLLSGLLGPGSTVGDFVHQSLFHVSKGWWTIQLDILLNCPNFFFSGSPIVKFPFLDLCLGYPPT